MFSSVSGLSGFNQSSMIQMRQQMFGKIDTNGDGKHDADELAQMVANGPKGGPCVEDILGRFDTDGDGSISESEFSAAGTPPLPPMDAAGSTSTADFIEKMFSQIDTNSDGTIDSSELEQMAAMGPAGGPGADKLLAELDTDGDGSISGSEFNDAMEGSQAGYARNTLFDTLLGTLSNDDGADSSTAGDGSIDSIISSLQALNSALSAYIQSNASSYSENNYVRSVLNGGSSLYA